MLARIGFLEILMVLIMLAIIAGIIYAVLMLIHNCRNTSKRLEEIEKILVRLDKKSD